MFCLPSEKWSTLYDKNLLPVGTHVQKGLAVQKSKQEVTKVVLLNMIDNYQVSSPLKSYSCHTTVDGHKITYLCAKLNSNFFFD